MPDATGLDLIRELVAATPETERPQILMMTAHATIESAIEAMKLGALDYLQKPFEVEELLVVVRRALEHQRLELASAVSAERARRRIQSLRHRRPQPGDGRGDSQGRAGRRDQEHRAHHRRNGHRQRARGPRDSRAQRAAQHAAHQGELRGHSGDAARVGAVRPRARRLHRRGHEQEGQVRPGRRRHHPARRDRHDEPRAAVEAAARAPGAGIRAARVGAQSAGRCPRDCRQQQRPPADGAGWHVSGGPVLPAQRHPDRNAAAQEPARGHSHPDRPLRP